MKVVSRQPDAEIPTASMADIAFLLIIFFMVTSVFSATKGLEFSLPKDEEKQGAEGDEAVFIKVAADGFVTVDCRAMQLEEILPYIEPKLLRNPEKPVILYTDAAAPYQSMISVYDVLGSAKLETHGYKVKNISVPTQSEVQDYIELFGMNPFESQCGE